MEIDQYECALMVLKNHVGIFAIHYALLPSEFFSAEFIHRSSYLPPPSPRELASTVINDFMISTRDVRSNITNFSWPIRKLRKIYLNSFYKNCSLHIPTTKTRHSCEIPLHKWNDYMHWSTDIKLVTPRISIMRAMTKI